MEAKFIVKNKDSGEFWLAEGEGYVSDKEDAHQYTTEELYNHRFKEAIVDRFSILIPVITKEEK